MSQAPLRDTQKVQSWFGVRRGRNGVKMGPERSGNRPRASRGRRGAVLRRLPGADSVCGRDEELLRLIDPCRCDVADLRGRALHALGHVDEAVKAFAFPSQYDVFEPVCPDEHPGFVWLRDESWIPPATFERVFNAVAAKPPYPNMAMIKRSWDHAKHAFARLGPVQGPPAR